jgi:hypothetical protein
MWRRIEAIGVPAVYVRREDMLLHVRRRFRVLCTHCCVGGVTDVLRDDAVAARSRSSRLGRRNSAKDGLGSDRHVRVRDTRKISRRCVFEECNHDATI